MTTGAHVAGRAEPVRLSHRPTSRAIAFLLDPAVVLNVFLIVAVLTRLYGVNLVLTSDEGYWLQRSVRFSAALARGELDMTYRTGHPGVTVMWTGLAGMGPEMLRHFQPLRYIGYSTLERDASYLTALASARYAMVLTTSALLTLVVALTWRLFGRGPALLGGAWLLLDPYVVGMTRLLHVDALLGPLMAVSALAGLIWWRGGAHRSYLVLSAVAGGLAVLTKAPAIYLPVYFGIVGLFVAWSQRSLRFWLGSTLVWGLLSLAVYGLLWPVMWIEPVAAARLVVEFALRQGGSPHNWSNYFLGTAVTTDPGMLFYPVALALRLGPVVLVGLIATAVALVMNRPEHRRDRQLVAALAAYALGFMVLMTLGGKKFDRYMLPAMIVLDILGGVGLWMLLATLQSAWCKRAALVSAVGVPALLLWSAYPYPLATYNPVFGGTATARQAMMLGWGEGIEEVAAYLNRQPNAERLVASTLYHHALRPLFRGRTVRIVEPFSPDYYVEYVNMEQRQLTPPGLAHLLEGQEPVFTVQIHGVEYAKLYRLTPGIPVLQPGQTFVPDDEEPDEGPP